MSSNLIVETEGVIDEAKTCIKCKSEKIDQQELQHLITVSTGFIDAYIIDCHGKEPNVVATKHCCFSTG